MSPVNKEKNMKEELLIAAGQCFAADGYAGASIRNIIQKAGATLSSITYYFGGKDQLYLETIRYVLGEKIDLATLFRRYIQAKTKTNQEISNHLFKLVHVLFSALAGMNHPAWYGRFLARAMLESRSEANRLIVDLIDPSIQDFKKTLHRQLPHLSKKTVLLFFPCLVGQIHYFIIAKELILMAEGTKVYAPDTLHETIEQIAVNMILPLGLPIPQITIED